MHVPLLDLKQQYEKIEKEVEEAVKEVLRGGYYILGPNVEAFEHEIAQYCGTKYAVGVASGTDALRISLAALGIGKEDEVITIPFTFIATTEAIAQTGARPVFVDIDEETFNINPEKIEEAITEKTKAIIPVHLYGQPADMGPIMRIAKKYKLKVIEDAAQAIGVEYSFTQSSNSDQPLSSVENSTSPNSNSTKKVGSIGDAGCLSFFPTKNLGGCGDGGMIITDDEKIARRAKALRVHGQSSNNYFYSLAGYNSRLDELQATILTVKLRYLDEWIKIRRKKASLYNQLLSSSSMPIKLPLSAPYRKHTYSLYTIRISKRDELKEYLQKKGIGTKIYYPLPLHLQKIYGSLGYREGDLPVAEKASKEVLSLPIYPELGENKVELVGREINNFFTTHCSRITVHGI